MPWALALLLSGLAAPSTVAAAQPPPICGQLAVSPTFGADGTAVCALPTYVDGSSERFDFGSREAGAFWVTTDRGRTWKERSALVSDRASTNQHDELANVWLSPLYPKDGLLFVAMSRSGLYSSSDLGRTFTQVDPAATQQGINFGGYRWGYDQLTPFVGRGVATPLDEQLGTLVPPQVFFAYAGNTLPSALVDPIRGVHAFVVAAPTPELHFSIPRGFDVDTPAIAITGISPPGQFDAAPGLYACTPALACPVPLAQFPVTTQIEGLWFGEDYDAKQTVYVALTRALFRDAPSTPVLQALRSTDRGATFAPWTSVQRLIQPIIDANAYTASMQIATHPKRPDRMWLLLTYHRTHHAPSGSPPEVQLFRSDDAGVKWRRTAYRYLDYDGRPDRGNFPGYSDSWRYWGSHGMTLTDDGRLVLIATSRNHRDMWYPTMWCTTDGSSFRRSCP